NASGLKLIEILIFSIGPDAGAGGDVVRTGQKSVDVVAVQLMQSPRVDIGAGDGNIFPKAMLDPDRRLHVDWGRKVGRYRVGCGCGLACAQRTNGKGSFAGGRVLHHILLLVDAILSNGL